MNGDGKISLAEAKAILNYDADLHDEDFKIQNLIDAVPRYIQECTGLTPAEQEEEPICKAITRCLLIKWFDMTEDFDKSIDTMLATLKFQTVEKRAMARLEAT